MRKFLLLFYFLTGWFVVHLFLIVGDGLSDNYQPTTLGIILGNQVTKEGNPSERLKSRLDKGLELLQGNVIQKVIVSGAIGKEGFPEGTAMKNYLIRKGISANRIVVDNNGTTTWASAENTRRLVPLTDTVIVISQYYHISRTKLAFKKNGFPCVYGAHSKYHETRDMYSLFREFFGYYSYLLR